MAFLIDINVIIPFAFGAFGGFLYVLYKNHGDLEFPYFRRYKIKGNVFSMGFLADIILGGGAGFVAANLALAVQGVPVGLAFVSALLSGFAGGKYLFKKSEELSNETSQIDAEVDRIIKQLESKKDK